MTKKILAALEKAAMQWAKSYPIYNVEKEYLASVNKLLNACRAHAKSTKKGRK